jgi:exopolysaccharide transport family protein
MLQGNFLPNDRARTLLDGSLQGSADAGGIGELVNFLLGYLRRQYAVILVTSILVLATSIIYLKTTPPTFTGKVKILFGNPKTQFVQQQSLVAEAPFDLSQIETQLEVLRSKAIANTVIGQLKLVDDPDFKPPGQRVRSFWQRLRGEPASPSEPIDQAKAAAAVVSAFENRLSASRVGMSKVIEISFNASSANRAAEIANAVANAYIEDQLSWKFEANRSATSWLQDRLRELGQQAQTAERAVNDYKREHNIVVSDGKPIDDQLVTDLNSRLVAAQAQTAGARARLDRFESILKSNAPNSASIGNLDASSSEALSNPIINNLRQQYLEYARREAEWSSRYGRNHLAVVNLRNRMHDIRASILDEVRRLAETSRGDYEVAKQRQQGLEMQLAAAVSQSRTTNSAELTLRELETKAKSYRSLYDSFLQRYMGSIQQESFPISEARIISPAIPPQRKTKPKSLLVLVLGLFGGIALGAGLGLLRDMMDRVFRTTAQIESILHLPCLSLVPRVKDTANKKHIFSRVARGSNQGFTPHTIRRNSGILWTATEMPLSRFAESIRSIKLAIDLNPTKTSNKVVGITSALPNEGKSTISASLAQLIGHAGKRTIIVDCDLKNPSLSTELAPTASAGIIEVISGAKTLEETIWRDPKTNLEFLPVVKRNSLVHTSEILSAEQTRTLFDKLRASYDYIIVDLPPLAPVVDVRATTQLVDCFILVVEWGRTKIDVVQHALHTAPNVYETLIGTVLNKTDMKALKRYNGYQNDYYHNEHYVRYGYVD